MRASDKQGDAKFEAEKSVKCWSQTFVLLVSSISEAYESYKACLYFRFSFVRMISVNTHAPGKVIDKNAYIPTHSCTPLPITTNCTAKLIDRSKRKSLPK